MTAKAFHNNRFFTLVLFAILIIGLIATPVFAAVNQWPWFQRTISGSYDSAMISAPTGVDATDSRLFIADRDNHRILVFDLSASYLAKIGPSIGASDNLNMPRGVAADPVNNTVFVADTANHRIVKFTKDAGAETYTKADEAGTKGSIGSTCDVGTQTILFNTPYDIATDPANSRVYVADTSNNRVVVLDLDLNLVDCWTNSGSPLNQPRGVAYGPAVGSIPASIYIADTNNHRIVQLNAGTGAQISAFGTQGTLGAGRFNSPSGVAVDTLGFVYVADTVNNAVHKLTYAGASPSDGARWTTTVNTNAYSGPYAVAALTENRIFVADTNNNRVQAYEMEEYPTSLTLNGSTTGISVNEIDTPNTVIGTLSATDPNLLSTFTYSFQTYTGCDSTDNGKFNIYDDPSSTDYLLRVNTILDYESDADHIYHICVRVYDGAASTYGGPGYLYNHFAITIIDSSDAPTIVANGSTTVDIGGVPTPDVVYFDEWTEDGGNTMPGDRLGGTTPAPTTLTVRDNDLGDSMTFELTGGTFMNAFDLVPQSDGLTADLIVKNCEDPGCDAYKTLLNYENYAAGSAYGTLIVEATDTNSPPNTDTITITVMLNNSNDYPVITLPATTFEINENLTTATRFGDLIFASDVDPGETLSLITYPTSYYFNTVTITTNTWRMITRSGRPIDFETNPSFDVPLRATDGEGYTYATVHVNVIDRNDRPVLITPYELHNSTPVGAPLNLVSAPDAGDWHEIAITDVTGDGLTGNEEGYFEVVSNQIRLARAVTAGQTFNLEVSVQDHRTDPAYPLTTGTILINVTEGNRTPVFVTDPAPALTVPENTTSGSFVVGNISATDADGDPLTFSTDTSDPANPFIVTTNGNQGVVTVNTGHPGLLNYETAATYDLTVNVTDNIAAPVAHTFTVAITNVNEEIFITNPDLVLEVGDRTPVNTGLDFIDWTDVDGVTNTQPIFTLTGDGVDQFGIRSNGEIYILPTANLHYYLKPSYAPTITIQDKIGTDASIKTDILPINLVDNNDPPTFDEHTYTLPENSLNGTVVGTGEPFEIFDENGDDFTVTITGGEETYSITQVEAGTRSQNGVVMIYKKFQIQVIDNTRLDYDTAVNHQVPIAILATDDHSASRSHSYNINLTNVNESPVLEDQSFMTYQNISGGTTIGTIAASDPDTGTTLTYISIPGGTGTAYFELDPASSTSGKIKVKTTAKPQPGTYTLLVKVRDNGSPQLESGQATMTIVVTPLADPAITTVTLPAGELLIGSATQYNVTVSNLEDGISSSYEMRLKLPTGVGFVVTGSSAGCAMKSADTVGCPGAALAPMGSEGDTASFVVNAYIFSNVLPNVSRTTTASLLLSDPVNDIVTGNNSKPVSFIPRKSIIITEQDFETQNPEDLTVNDAPITTATQTPDCEDTTNPQKFAGLFSNDEVAYTKDVISHSKVEVFFDLYLAQTWDGLHQTLGPDRWKFCSGDCSVSIVDTTFSLTSNDEYLQSFPDTYASGLTHPAKTGASQVNTLGYHYSNDVCVGDPMDAIYTFHFTLEHADPTIALKFIAQGLSAELNAEKWGIDNLKVIIYGEDSFNVYLPAVRR